MLLGLRGCVHIVLVDTQHLRQTFVAIIDITWVHLIQYELITLMILLSELSFQLLEVDRKVLARLSFQLLFLESVGSLSLSILDAPLAWLSFSPSMPMSAAAPTLTMGLFVGTSVPPGRQAAA